MSYFFKLREFFHFFLLWLDLCKVLSYHKYEWIGQYRIDFFANPTMLVDTHALFYQGFALYDTVFSIITLISCLLSKNFDNPN